MGRDPVRLIVAIDPMSQTLAVLKRGRAVADAGFIRTLVAARIIGHRLVYERAIWLRSEASQAIVTPLRGLNCGVDDGPTAQAILNDFDFGNVR